MPHHSDKVPGADEDATPGLPGFHPSCIGLIGPAQARPLRVTGVSNSIAQLPSNRRRRQGRMTYRGSCPIHLRCHALHEGRSFRAMQCTGAGSAQGRVLSLHIRGAIRTHCRNTHRETCLKTSSRERAKLVRLNASLASTVSDGQDDGMMLLCCNISSIPSVIFYPGSRP